MTTKGPRDSGRCSRCGAPASWVVTLRYGPTSSAGRLLIHCDRCRGEMAAQLGTVLPLTMVAEDPETVLTLLYRSGATDSDPGMVAEIVGVATGAWSDTAAMLLDRRGIGGEGFSDR